MRKVIKDGESKAEWLKKVRKAPCSKLTREWFGCDDEIDRTSNTSDIDHEIKIGDFVTIVDPKGDEYLAETLNDNGMKFHGNGHTFWLGKSGAGMAFAKKLIISSRVASAVINDVQQP